MKSTFTFLIFAFTINLAYCQSNKVFVELNYNTFSHSSLKNFQEEFVNDVGEVDLRINDNFPSNFGFTLGYKIDRINTSILASYTNTGGKISYADFSGTIRLTQPLTGYSLGGLYELELLEDNNAGQLYLGLKGFLTYSTLDITSFNEFNGVGGTETISTTSIDFGGGLTFIYEYPISIVILRANIGADLVLGGKQFLVENRDFFIEDNSGSAVRTEWTGIKAGLGVAIPL